MLLKALGFHAIHQQNFDSTAQPGQVPARISVGHRGQLMTLSDDGERLCTIAGRLRHEIDSGQSTLPQVGDWAVVTATDDGHGVITHVLPRTTVLWRRQAGSDDKAQVLLANVDTVCVVSALDGDVNPRRVERFLALVMEGGCTPVIVLTKTDLCENLDGKLEIIRSVAGTIPIFAVSALTGEGMDALTGLLFGEARSVALLGSSGVGKSTLINRWMGREIMVTGEVRDDGKGRHTTTHRELLVRPDGGVLMDTPGVREVGLVAAEDGLASVFSDVEVLAQGCRFPDCAHANEPGCAVRDAVERGILDEDRLHAWKKLQRENAHARLRDDPRGQRAQKDHAKVMQKALRSRLKEKRR